MRVLNLRRGGGIYYRIHLWLYWQQCASDGWRVVLSLTQDLESKWPRPRYVLDLNGVWEGGTVLGK